MNFTFRVYEELSGKQITSQVQPNLTDYIPQFKQKAKKDRNIHIMN